MRKVLPETGGSHGELLESIMALGCLLSCGQAGQGSLYIRAGIPVSCLCIAVEWGAICKL
jgi:hypothetical protein